MLFRKPASGFPGRAAAECDGAVTFIEHGPPWDRYAAGAVAFDPRTPRGRAFCAHVAGLIADNLLHDKGVWFLDQMALFAAAEHARERPTLLRAPPERACSVAHDEDAALWAITVDKTSDNNYQRFKRELLETYGDPAADARMDENPNEVAPSRYGLLVVNKHDMWIGPSIKRFGVWCEPEVDAMRPFVRAGDVVIDVGANIGCHTLAFAQMVGPAGAVYAFEPQRLVWQNLVAALALNWVRNVHCINAAVGAASGQARVPAINYGERNNIGALSLRPDWSGSSEVRLRPGAETETVPLVPLDDLALARCRLLKIDVEGMELDVLKGAQGLIERARPVLYVEYHAHKEEIRAFLSARGYRLFRHDVPGNPNLLALPDASFDAPALPRLARLDAQDLDPAA